MIVFLPMMEYRRLFLFEDLLKVSKLISSAGKVNTGKMSFP